MHGEKNNRNNNGIDTGKTAVAIEYVPGEAAPKILATGKGIVADKIIERAKESNGTDVWCLFRYLAKQIRHMVGCVAHRRNRVGRIPFIGYRNFS